MIRQPFEDNFQRKFYYLRLSVTDVCNFKCTYCLPDGYKPAGQKNSSFLSLSEIENVVQAFAACGTSKIRITGGEPTLRKDFTDIVNTIATTDGVDKIAVTTNGFRLEKHVDEWLNAGLTNINISVDSLNPNMFYQITGENKFHQVMAGVEKALAIGGAEIKINVVLMKGINHKELPQFLNWIKHRPVQLRFIELMQTGEMDSLFQQHHLSGNTTQEQLIQDGWVPKVRNQTDGPAQVYVHPDYHGSIGLIQPYEKNFCQGCNRLRISAKGKLHLCLFGEEGVDLRDLLQSPQSQDELITRIQSSLNFKEQTHHLHDGNSGVTPHLASIGG